MIKAIDGMIARLPRFDRASVGFPGVTKKGVTYIAVNLHPRWKNFPLAEELTRHWKKPTRVANDAAVQGYGAIKGSGVEMILTLGTGLGSSLFTDGQLCPGLELGHHPWRKMTYEDYLGRRGIERFANTAGTISFSLPLRRPPAPLTGINFIWGAATPGRSASRCRPT